METFKPAADRRKHPRYDGDEYPLRLGRHSGQLVDWSAGGVAVRIKEGTAHYETGDPVTLSIPSDHTLAVAVFHGRIQRVDPAEGIVGIMFVDDGENAVRLLVDLVGAMRKE